MSIQKNAIVWLLSGMMLGVPIAQQSIAIAQTQPAPKRSLTDQLYLEAVKLYRQGKYRDAFEKAQQASKANETDRDSSLQGSILSLMGMIYSSVGQYGKALESYQQSLAIRKQINDRSGQAASLNNIAMVYERTGEGEKALFYFQQALVIATEINDRYGIGSLYNNMASVYLGTSQYKKALEFYEKALVIRRELRYRDDEGTTLNNLGTLWTNLGNYSKALEYFTQSLTIARELKDRAGEGLTLSNMGSTYSRLGQLDKALEFHQQALVIMQEVQARPREGLVLNHIGWVYSSLGQYSEALKFFQRALAVRREVGDPQGEANTLNDIGLLYRRLGQNTRALQYFQQTLALTQKVKDRAGEGIVLNNIGLIYQDLEQYDKAAALYRQSLAIAKETGDRLAEKTPLNSLGLIYQQAKQYDKALEMFQQSLALARESGERSAEATALSNLGSLYSRQDKYDQALAFYRQALPIAKDMKDRPTQAFILMKIGTVLVQLDQLAAAEQPLYDAIDLFEALRPGLGDRDKISLADQNSQPYYWLQIALVRQNKLGPALAVSERSRSRALIELLTSRLPANAAHLKQLSQPLSIAQIQQVAQQQNATLVQYTTFGEALYAWVVRPDGSIDFRRTVTKNGQFTIAQLTESTRGAIGIANRSEAFISVTQGSGEVTKKTDSALRTLHQHLIEPIADLLPKKETDRVIFIPQGQLFFVPFAALMDANGKHLIEKHTISTASSIATLRLTAEKRNTKQNRNNNALVIGNPIMPTLENGILKPLPGAEEEAKVIAPLLNVKPLIGAAATKSSVVKQMQNASIIHLATHGLLDSVKGDVPGAIALTPDNPNEVGNGLLTANELFDLKLNANLVVLSACDTAKGDITGDGVVGLSRSLIAAGVPSIVVSLWSVNDNSTAFLMKDFYRNLQTMDKAQALRQAMLKTMRQPQYQKPYFWSAFTLIGEAE